MWSGYILTMLTDIICERYQGRSRHERTFILISVMASSGVVKVILRFYRDDDKGAAFQRHRGPVPFDMAKHNSIPANFS